MNPFAAIAVGYAKHRPPHLDEIRAWCAETLWTDPEGDILLPGYYCSSEQANRSFGLLNWRSWLAGLLGQVILAYLCARESRTWCRKAADSSAFRQNRQDAR